MRWAGQWEEGFAHLKRFVERTGDARVPVKLKTADGYPLGEWTRRQHRNQARMSAERASRLEALTGWVWRTIYARRQRVSGLGPSGT